MYFALVSFSFSRSDLSLCLSLSLSIYLNVSACMSLSIPLFSAYQSLSFDLLGKPKLFFLSGPTTKALTHPLELKVIGF